MERVARELCLYYQELTFKHIMARRIIREYGLIVTLVIVGLVSIFFYRSYRRFDLESALDKVGTQFLSVVDDTAGKEAVSRLYSAFKSRVMNKEVTPEQVELLAVNVLNLSSSGETLTADEAEDVLDIALGSTVITPPTLEVDVTALNEVPVPAAEPEMLATLPGVPEAVAQTVVEPEKVAIAAPPALDKVYPSPVPEERLDRLGRRLHVMLDFEEAYDRVEERDPRGTRGVRHLEITGQDGARVVLDMEALDAIRQTGSRDVERLLERMESVALVRWDGNVKELQSKREAARLKALERMTKTIELEDKRIDREAERALAQFERFHRLESKGVVLPFDLDSLERVVEIYFEKAAELKEKDWETDGE